MKKLFNYFIFYSTLTHVKNQLAIQFDHGAEAPRALYQHI